MSSSGVVDVVSPSPRDFQLTSKVPCLEVSRVVLPEPLNSSPFHWVLALLTTAMVLSRYVVATAASRGRRRRSATGLCRRSLSHHSGRCPRPRLPAAACPCVGRPEGRGGRDEMIAALPP